jgi:hypothetical protein
MTITTVNHGSYLQISSNDVNGLIRKELTDRGLNYYAATSDNGKITRYRLTDIKINDGLTELQPEIFFRNSETPGTALMLYIGAYRFICANGLVLGVGDGGRLIHRVGQTADTFVAGISDMISRSVIHLVDDLQDVITESRAIKVNNAIEIVASLPIQATVKQDALNKIVLGRTKEDVSTVWGLYNEVNALTRLRTKKANNALEKDIGLLDHIKLLNQYTKAA